MKTRGTGRKKRREGLGNRLAIIGITIVVLSLAVVVNVKNTSMEKKLMEYQAKEESLTRQVENEQKAILLIVRRLAETGEMVIGSGEDTYV